MTCSVVMDEPDEIHVRGRRHEQGIAGGGKVVCVPVHRIGIPVDLLARCLDLLDRAAHLLEHGAAGAVARRHLEDHALYPVIDADLVEVAQDPGEGLALATHDLSHEIGRWAVFSDASVQIDDEPGAVLDLRLLAGLGRDNSDDDDYNQRHGQQCGEKGPEKRFHVSPPCATGPTPRHVPRRGACDSAYFTYVSAANIVFEYFYSFFFISKS